MNRSDAASNSITPSSLSLTPVTLGSLSIFGIADSGWPLVLRNFLPRAQYNHHARSHARSPLRFPDPSQSAPVQTPQNELMDERENGGIRADSESQRKNGYGAEQRRFTKGPEGVAQILRESGHDRYTARAEKSYAVTCGPPRASSFFAPPAPADNQQ